MAFLTRIDAQVPEHLEVHLVMDNDSTQKAPAIQRWPPAHPRSTVHFTPTSSSWLNLVERWFAELTTKKVHRSVRALNVTSAHESAPPALGLAQDQRTDLDSIARCCDRIADSGH